MGGHIYQEVWGANGWRSRAAKNDRSILCAAQCSLDVEGVRFVNTAPPPAPAPELQELKKLVEDQRMAMEGLRKELAEVSAKSQAAAKKKMAGVPPLSKAELLKVVELDAKP